MDAEYAGKLRERRSDGCGLGRYRGSVRILLQFLGEPGNLGVLFFELIDIHREDSFQISNWLLFDCA